ncbi:hypothetical protein QWY77_00510 [Thalassotalea ponticola]|uniref:hypothetical protein n=1 Tax=Thalassotalea ponticola TaxID=1523392 RepID=UPI0025B5EE33|nr:hypothetical protein [Thalassotalea ponticola]MDN3651265.1 hypothetical protein [Thalassotalea ponticola]
MMKVVESLPEDIIQQANAYMAFHPRAIFLYLAPIFMFYLGTDVSDITNNNLIAILRSAILEMEAPILGVLAIYLFIILFSKLSRILWKFNKPQWFKYYLSLTFAIGVAIFSKHFNFNHWLLHDYGYLTDANIGPFVALSGFIPMIAAHLDSFKAVELAFYKSKGYDYRGRLIHSLNID